MTHGGIVIVLQSIQAQNPPSTQSTFREVLMSTVTYNAIGYAAQNAKAPLAPMQFNRRAPRPDDVAIEVLYCGVCHSDIHQARDERDGRNRQRHDGRCGADGRSCQQARKRNHRHQQNDERH